jgi:hypothetical protein
VTNVLKENLVNLAMMINSESKFKLVHNKCKVEKKTKTDKEYHYSYLACVEHRSVYLLKVEVKK